MKIPSISRVDLIEMHISSAGLIAGVCAALLLWQICSTIDGHVNPRLTTEGLTPPCALVSPSARKVEFSVECGKAESVVLGTDLLTVGEKCCVSSSMMNNFSALQSNLSVIVAMEDFVPLVDSWNSNSTASLRNCPKLSGSVVPLGFYVSFVGSGVAAVLSLVLNLLEYAWLRVWNLPQSSELSMIEHLLRPHGLLYVKTFLAVAAGTAIAIIDAKSAANEKSFREAARTAVATVFLSQYSVYGGVIIHGAVAKALSDYFSMLFSWIIIKRSSVDPVVVTPVLAVSVKSPKRIGSRRQLVRSYSNHETTRVHVVTSQGSREPVQDGQDERQLRKIPDETWSRIMTMPLPEVTTDPFALPPSPAARLVTDHKVILLLLLPFLPLVATHIIPGLVFYFLPVAILSAACAVIVGFCWLIVSRCTASWPSRVAVGILLAAAINFFIHLVVRLSYSCIVLTYSSNGPLFLYADPVGWGAVWVQRVYFFFQISSNSCYSVYATESLKRSVELVLVLL
jgi:hypothetical protein